MNVQIIEKEQIKFLKFPKEDVFKKKKDRINRKFNLKRGLILGNLERQKVRINFVANSGLKSVETTIWGITDKAVILKQAIVIPLERITSIT